MWVEGGDIHDELLDQLGGVLAPPEDLALMPSPAELEMLAAAVAARWPDGAVAPAAEEADGSPGRTPASPGSPVRPFGPGTRRSLRRLGSGAWRAGSVAAGLVLVSASAAAAANGGVPLPRPVRVVAYTVGLPVDSPALDDTHQHIKELKAAVKAQDKPKAEASVRRLQQDRAKVPADEKKEALPKIEKAIEQAVAAQVVPAPSPTTTTTLPSTPATTAPAPAPSTTATTEDEKDRDKDKDRDKPSGTTKTTETTTTTTTTEPESTTTTTAPATDENPSGEPGAGGDGGSIGTDPGPTTSTTAPETTTTTVPPPEETTTTTTTTHHRSDDDDHDGADHAASGRGGRGQPGGRGGVDPSRGRPFMRPHASGVPDVCP